MSKAQGLCVTTVSFVCFLSFSTTRDQAELLAQMFPKDSKEYKLLLRYAQKKQSPASHPPQSNGVEGVKNVSPVQPQDSRKSRKFKKRFSKLVRCIQPVKEDDASVARPYRQRAAAGSCECQNATLQ